MESYIDMDRPQSPPISSRNNSISSSRSSNSNIPTNTSFSNKMARSVSIPWQGQELPPPYTSDYLTPTNPDNFEERTQPPRLPALPQRGFNRQPSGTSRSSVGSQTGDGRPSVPRSDSGIEADFQVRGQLPSSSSTNPRSSTIYECIDSGPYTEPSPHFFQGPSSGGETTSSGLSSAPTTALLLPIGSSHTEDGRDDNARQRLHPAYSALNNSTPQVYTETCLTCTGTKKSILGSRGSGVSGVLVASRKHLRYLWCGLALLTLMTLFLLTVIAYIFFVLIPGMQAHIRVQEGDLKRMQWHYQNLTEKMDTLLAKPTANQSALSDTMVEGVAVTVAELNDSIREFQSQLRQLGSDLHFRIDNISQMPDLKGISAVGNLSSCFSYKTTSVQALPGPASTTSWQPMQGSDKLRDNVVMSATCGVEGGNQHFVETRALSAEFVQYRCQCDGNLSLYDRRKCHIYLVLCPRKLPVDLTAAGPPSGV